MLAHFLLSWCTVYTTYNYYLFTSNRLKTIKTDLAIHLIESWNVMKNCILRSKKCVLSNSFFWNNNLG